MVHWILGGGPESGMDGWIAYVQVVRARKEHDLKYMGGLLASGTNSLLLLLAKPSHYPVSSLVKSKRFHITCLA